MLAAVTRLATVALAAAAIGSCYRDVSAGNDTPIDAGVDAARDAQRPDGPAPCFPDPFSGSNGWSVSSPADVSFNSGTLGMKTEPGTPGFDTTLTSDALAISSLSVHIAAPPIDGASTLEIALLDPAGGSVTIALSGSDDAVTERAGTSIMQVAGEPLYWGFQVAGDQVTPEVGSAGALSGSDKFTLPGGYKIQLSLIESASFQASAALDQLVVSCTP